MKITLDFFKANKKLCPIDCLCSCHAHVKEETFMLNKRNEIEYELGKTSLGGIAYFVDFSRRN